MTQVSLYNHLLIGLLLLFSEKKYYIQGGEKVH
jgi:hypothetical protein